MAAKSDMFLTPEQRLSLIEEILQEDNCGGGRLEAHERGGLCIQNSTSFGTGCLHCGEDDDHANILLCEGCNDEYHTYCLDPPLRSVPTGDWYCCKYYSGQLDDIGDL